MHIRSQERWERACQGTAGIQTSRTEQTWASQSVVRNEVLVFPGCHDLYCVEKGSAWGGCHWAWIWMRGVMGEVDRSGQMGGVFWGSKERTLLMG